MKILRSTKCSLKFATAQKREALERILQEYADWITNRYIDDYESGYDPYTYDN